MIATTLLLKTLCFIFNCSNSLRKLKLNRENKKKDKIHFFVTIELNEPMF